MTQKELAKRVGIETVQVSRYERGHVLPNAETLVALSRVLRVDIDMLLRGQPRESGTIETPLDVPLLERLRDLQKVSKQDRAAVLLILDSVLARADVESRMKRRA